MEALFLTFDTLLEGRYLIQGIVGEGGFAVVYEARDQKLGQQVAVKALTYGGLGEEARARFEQEARMAASLHHSDIVRVQDYGVTPQGAPFFVMEMLQGYTLDQELWQHGAMDVERALRLLARCLHALDTAHANGIVHRDLKPSNLFLVHPATSAESLTILDLGLGYLIEHEADRLTGDLTLLGTAGYLAPEYLEQRIVTPAMDVYQMGLVFLEMISGGSPEGGPQSAWITKGGELLPSDAVREVILRALHADYGTRYPHAGAMLEALEAARSASVQVALAITAPDLEGEDAPTQPSMHPGKRVALILMGFIGVMVLVSVLMYIPDVTEGEIREEVHPLSVSAPKDQPTESSSTQREQGKLDEAPDSPRDLVREDDAGGLKHEPEAVPSVPSERSEPPRPALKDEPLDVSGPDVLDPELSRELEWLKRGR